MLEDPNLINPQESQPKQNEAFVESVKNLEIKEDPNSPLSEQNIQKRKEEDDLQIQKIMQELKVPGVKKEELIVEKEIFPEEIGQRIVDEKEVQDIGRKQQEKIDRYNVGPEELAILTWEDKATAAQKDIEEYQGYLNLSEEDFMKRYGPDPEAVREMKEDIIPRHIEQKTKLIKESQEIAKKLREEKNIENAQQGRENEATKRFESNMKSLIEDISSKSKTMIDALYERQEQRLTPLQNPDEFQGIVKHLKDIKNFDEKFDVYGLESINQNLKKITRLVEGMNPKNTGGGIKENPQNLEKLAYGARAFSGSLDEAGRNLGPELGNEKMEEKRKELRKSIGALSEEVQKLNSLASRMRSNFR